MKELEREYLALSEKYLVVRSEVFPLWGVTKERIRLGEAFDAKARASRMLRDITSEEYVDALDALTEAHRRVQAARQAM